AVPRTVAASDQPRPLAIPTEVPGLEPLAMIRSARRDHLWRVARNQHEAPATRRRPLHVDVDDVLLLHGSLDPFPVRGRRPARNCRRSWQRGCHEWGREISRGSAAHGSRRVAFTYASVTQAS